MTESEADCEKEAMSAEPETEARGPIPYWDSCYSSHFPLPQWDFVATPDTDTGIQFMQMKVIYVQYKAVGVEPESEAVARREKCTSESSNSTCVTISPTRPLINYNVKVVNPVRKSEYVVRKVRGVPKYTNLDDVKAKICEKLNINIEEMGYISPGHGLKGKLNPLTCNEDLEDMYEEYKNKCDITLWCSTPSEHSKSDMHTEKKQRKKRSLTFDQSHEEVPQTTKKQGCAQKIKEVEAIMDTLREKHGSAYTVEQLSAWAHMIQMAKHVSVDIPPALPYFSKAQEKTLKEKREAGIQPAQQSSPPSVVLSPGKRISLRSECMDQLSKWYSLLEKGVISQSKYEELQETILGDISNL